MSTTYHVDGMSCGGCAASVERSIKALAPDAEVQVDLAAKTVTVAGLPDDQVMQQAVENAGFIYGGPG